jgi:hypothetical protein
MRTLDAPRTRHNSNRINRIRQELPLGINSPLVCTLDWFSTMLAENTELADLASLDIQFPAALRRIHAAVKQSRFDKAMILADAALEDFASLQSIAWKRSRGYGR